MTTIKINCPMCGSVDNLPAGALLASVDIEDPEIHLAGAVMWICSGCNRLATAALTWHQFSLVVTAGVPILDADTDDNLNAKLPPHPELPSFHSGRLTADDILDLHELLGTENWFRALTEMPTRPV